jgi:hypothetical protein
LCSPLNTCVVLILLLFLCAPVVCMFPCSCSSQMYVTLLLFYYNINIRELNGRIRKLGAVSVYIYIMYIVSIRGHGKSEAMTWVHKYLLLYYILSIVVIQISKETCACLLIYCYT